jgi:hypothetical protein
LGGSSADSERLEFVNVFENFNESIAKRPVLPVNEPIAERWG